jgi:hypothetical protein
LGAPEFKNFKISQQPADKMYCFCGIQNRQIHQTFRQFSHIPAYYTYTGIGQPYLGHIAEDQGVFARHEAQDRFDALYESYDANSVQGRSARARLLSCACRLVSAWLDTLPCTPALELKSGEVRTGLRHRLGLSMLPSNF